VRLRGTKSTAGSLIELVVIVAVALLLALGIQAWIVKPYRIPSSSMEPTLTIGQRVLVNRIGTHFSGPHVGEVIVFHPPRDATSEVCGAGHPSTSVCQYPETQESDQNFIKRVVAGPGDVITIKAGHVYRNGQPEKDSYTRPCGPQDSSCDFPTPVRIPAGHWFMMGDNRGESDDSRFWGPVPTKWIIGGAFATYWPLDRLGFL
jgi:signal peptidase I